MIAFIVAKFISLLIIKTQNKGKERENSPKIEDITGGKAHVNTRKLNLNILTITEVFLNQNRVNVCEHTTKMASLESLLKGATRVLREEWMEGNLKGNYLRLIPGLCLDNRMNW